MIINKIHINEFGNLKNRDIELGCGINIIRGDNESGKSTLMSFLRFVFYGMPQARGAENSIERERSFNWSSGNASGYIEISDGEGQYRIERSASLNTPERHTIVNLTTGAPVFAGADAGDVFFKIPKEVYDSVCASRQLGVGNLDGTAVGSAIQNMLLSGDETVNTESALKKLEKVRRELLPLRGNGGKINGLRAREVSLKDRLMTARENTEKILALQSSVEKYRAVALDVRKQLDAAVDRCHAYESVAKLKQFNELRDIEKKLSALEAGRKEMTDMYGRDGVFPKNDYVDGLNSLYRRVTLAESELSVAKAELSNAKAAPGGDPILSARNADIASAGGSEAITAKYLDERKKCSVGSVLALVMAFTGIIIAVASIAAFFIFKQSNPLWLLFAAAVGLAESAIGFIMLPKAKKAIKKADAYLYDFGITDKITLQNAAGKVEEMADRCANAAALDTRRKNLISAAEEKLKTKENLYKQAVTDSEGELLKFPSIGEQSENIKITDMLSDKAEKISALIVEYNKLMVESGMLEKQACMLRKETSTGDDEATLRSHLLPDAAEKLEEYSLQKLNQDRDVLATRMDATNQKLAENEKTLAVLTHSTENPVRLSSELETAAAEREAAEIRSEAVLLAAETIRTSGDNLRQSVTPRIRKRAGEILCEITDGKYTDFGIDDEFNILISTDEGTKPVSVLSGGTRDAAYFALRISLMEMIFGNTMPPMMLDEICAQLDDSRTASVIRMLAILAGNGVQVLDFTCHKREEILLQKSGGDFSSVLL